MEDKNPPLMPKKTKEIKNRKAFVLRIGGDPDPLGLPSGYAYEHQVLHGFPDQKSQLPDLLHPHWHVPHNLLVSEDGLFLKVRVW